MFCFKGKRKKLEETIKELDKASKLLIRRDFELQQANNVLQELSQAKTQFVSIAAHQFRTPLSGIKWAFQMMLTEDFGPLNDTQRDVLERGYVMNEQLIRLVSDLLDVARMESGKFTYNFTTFDLTTFLEEIAELYVKKREDKKMDFKIQIPKKGEVAVSGDPHRISMVFQNLLDNAFNYTPEKGKISVSYGLDKENNMIEFQVKDTGIGIHEKDIPQLFTKFFRGEKAIKEETEGTGLGLYIAMTIIRVHGGKIWLESKVGKGTTFHFTIPLAKKGA